MASYKQRCFLCHKNWALVRSGRNKFAVCMECEMKTVVEPVEDSMYKKLFDIPLDWYKENPFLRSVRFQYGRYGDLSEKQIEAFKKTVKEMKEGKIQKK